MNRCFENFIKHHMHPIKLLPILTRQTNPNTSFAPDHSQSQGISRPRYRPFLPFCISAKITTWQCTSSDGPLAKFQSNPTAPGWISGFETSRYLPRSYGMIINTPLGSQPSERAMKPLNFPAERDGIPLVAVSSTRRFEWKMRCVCWEVVSGLILVEI